MVEKRLSMGLFSQMNKPVVEPVVKCCNTDEWRWRLFQTMQGYLPETECYDITSLNGIHFGQVAKECFDRVLLDAPCTNDRYLFWNRVTLEQIYRSFDNPWELQRTLLLSAINACKMNGVIVYSTCTVDHNQNDGVIEWLLNSSSGGCVKVEDIATTDHFEKYLNIRKTKHGYLVLPSVDKNWGPLFVSKLRKIITVL